MPTGNRYSVMRTTDASSASPTVRIQRCDTAGCSICGPNAEVPWYNPLPNRRGSGDALRRIRARFTRREREFEQANRDENDETHDKPTNCYCEACKLARFEGSKLRHAVIEGYSYEPPGGYKYHSVPDDPFNYYLGVELETDANGPLSAEVGADIRQPKQFWIAKHDGSVSGPEFASHPATLSWWRKHAADLEVMFTTLLHGGFSSHNGNHCGMHVNISRNAFDNSRHFYRFLNLIHGQPKWSIKMSQRTQSTATQWAVVGADKRTLKRISVGDETDKYVALNVPYSERRIRRAGYYDRNDNWIADQYEPEERDPSRLRYEFRLPRGTLRIDRFFKNLEWTVAMIEYTRTHTRVSDATPAKFMKWVADNEKKYPYLAGFISEKFGVS